MDDNTPYTAKYLRNNGSFSTTAIHGGGDPSNWKDGDLATPIALSTTYKQSLPPHHKGLQYTRMKNATRESLQQTIARLEETKHCIVVSSGMSAVVLTAKLLREGDHVVTQADLYHGAFNLFKTIDEENTKINVSFVDATEKSNVEKALQPNTKLVWLESPTNPLMKLIDLKSVTSLVKSRNPSAIVVCDNTFMSPYFQRPALLGVDIVMNSCTKYIGGHSDVLMGALCINDDDIYQRLLAKQILLGPVPSSFDCYLVIRSIKTLKVRMQKHMSNALQIAKFLEDHPMIEKVFHPGLPSHPQHQLSLRQCYGHSGMLSFYIRGHDFDTTLRILGKLRFIHLADSLGGVETTVKMPSQMPPGSLSKKEMESQGITDGLLRLSVGIEDVEDLICDLKQALDV